MNETEVFFSLGSNLGDRLGHLNQAFKLIQKKIGPITHKSSIYESEPWGKKDQSAFLNCVIGLKSTLKPEECLSIILEIEKEMGRERMEKWGPRTLDIDILIYGELIISNEKLEIPHPSMCARRFVMEPFSEICPNLIHPVFKKSVLNLSNACEDTSKIIVFKE